jgi:hypothetical protein
MASTSSSATGLATIPIKQVVLNKKFVPLVVSYAGEGGKEVKIPAKLYDVRCSSSIQSYFSTNRNTL